MMTRKLLFNKRRSPKILNERLFDLNKIYGNSKIGGGWKIQFRSYRDDWCELQRPNGRGGTEYTGDFFKDLDEDYVE